MEIIIYGIVYLAVGAWFLYVIGMLIAGIKTFIDVLKGR